MPDYEAKTVTASATAQKVVDAVNYDRTIHVNAGPNYSLGYTNISTNFVHAGSFSFILPEDEELWIKEFDPGPFLVHVLIAGK